jgi:hypothetical protein
MNTKLRMQARTMPATFDRFDICGAHLALENDYNNGGWISERPSNTRRRESSGVQLARMGFDPGRDSCGSFSYLANDNQRAIYVNALRAYGLPLDRYAETHADVWAFIDSQEVTA